MTEIFRKSDSDLLDEKANDSGKGSDADSNYRDVEQAQRSRGNSSADQARSRQNSSAMVDSFVFKADVDGDSAKKSSQSREAGSHWGRSQISKLTSLSGGKSSMSRWTSFTGAKTDISKITSFADSNEEKSRVVRRGSVMRESITPVRLPDTDGECGGGEGGVSQLSPISTDTDQPPSHEEIRDRRGVFKWLPILFCNDLVHG
eukprot:CAMPEP_0182433806 /NCGR_PEP_ID=MMETSP1167-20130531/65705_1 /TAXON_ID=2988 /ORGANISM="Mallomonas Sp, Strain CCMP3275" /LENGTH=202 /DNA_ID=CAMNT_0024622935 /DNA_START=117 /DNA_END=721 /DNA_ORIENTATION=-